MRHYFWNQHPIISIGFHSAIMMQGAVIFVLIYNLKKIFFFFTVCVSSEHFKDVLMAFLWKAEDIRNLRHGHDEILIRFSLQNESLRWKIKRVTEKDLTSTTWQVTMTARRRKATESTICVEILLGRPACLCTSPCTLPSSRCLF